MHSTNSGAQPLSYYLYYIRRFKPSSYFLDLDIIHLNPHFTNYDYFIIFGCLYPPLPTGKFILSITKTPYNPHTLGQLSSNMGSFTRVYMSATFPENLPLASIGSVAANFARTSEEDEWAEFCRFSHGSTMVI